MAFPIYMGPAELVYDGTTLGPVHENVNVSLNEPTAQGTQAKTGSIPVEEVVQGLECMVTGAIVYATLTEIAAICGGTISGGGSRLAISSRVGTNLVSSAKILIIKPIIGGVVSTTEGEWMYVPKASVRPVFDLVYGPASQKTYAFEFKGHVLTADDIASGADWAGLGYEAGNALVMGAAA